MPEPISLCIENLEDFDEETQFIRCVALEGGRPGLGIDARGRPLWMKTAGCACELWVSSDEQLILWRPQGAVASRVHRAGRSLDVPRAKPVVVLDQDEIEVAGVRLRLHVHGYATETHPPTPFVVARSAPAAALAAAVLLGSALGCDKGGETDGQAGGAATATATAAVTASTTTSTSTDTTTPPEPSATGAVTGTVTATSSTTNKPVTKQPPIEVRPRPPAPRRRDPEPKGDLDF